MTRASSVVAVLLATASLAVGLACGSSTDARRTSVSPSPAETSPLFRIHGVVVDAEAAPISGARVSVQAQGQPPAQGTLSDVEGAYSLDVERAEYHVISTEHEGFEPRDLFLTPFGREVRLDVRLQRIVRINAGESVTQTIVQSDQWCGDGDQSWLCRRVRVVAPVAGVLRLTVPSVPSAPGFLLRVADNWDITPAPSIAVPVSAGSETIVELLLAGQAPQTVRFSSAWGR